MGDKGGEGGRGYGITHQASSVINEQGKPATENECDTYGIFVSKAFVKTSSESSESLDE